VWTVALVRWLALIAGGISFGLAVVVLYLFAKLRRMGRARRMTVHVLRMAVAHLGLTLFGCVWIALRIGEDVPVFSIASPYLLFVFITSNAGLAGLLRHEYLRTLEKNG
jgi:hypothetical protein